LTGEPVEEAVAHALRDEVAKQRQLAKKLERLREISDDFRSLPVLDLRTPDEIIGYDESGLPT
jgi:antitoxin VapB